jgi:hypothetical protein
VPERFSRVATRQMQAEALHLCVDPVADFDQTHMQGVEPERGDALLPQPAPQRVEQPIGGNVEQQAKLVGPEARYLRVGGVRFGAGRVSSL